MKRFGQLMPQIAALDNVALAFRRASRGSSLSEDVVDFSQDLEDRLNLIVRELLNVSWYPKPYQRFVVLDPKQRVIHAAPFDDRVVHHALMNVAGPCFERGAVDTSYACRKGRGNRAAVQQAARWTRRYRFFLKLDVRRYFDSIRHATLFALFRRRFKDRQFLTLLERLLNSFAKTPNTGLPIGTLTSQYFANFYLDGLDRWITESLGCSGYVRYMDDFVLWHDDADVLAKWLNEIEGWLSAERSLELKGTVRPTACREGVPFLGYRITPRGVLLGKAARRRFASRLKKYEQSHADGLMTTADLQRRVDSLLAFTQFAICSQWRGRLLSLDCLTGQSELGASFCDS